MGTRLVGYWRTEAELSKLGLTWNSCHTTNTSSWTNIHYNSILYVYSVPHREKELASTSFGHMRAFNSLSRALSSFSQVWGRTRG